MKKELLPIGSVVLLKDAKKRIMITGFYVKENENSDKMYDYVGVLYPEGVVQSNKNLVFNHDQIDRIFFRGFNDLEEQQFKDRLYKLIEKDILEREKETIESGKTSEIPVVSVEESQENVEESNEENN